MKAQYWWIEKKSKDGFAERIIYTGSIRNKPKGWKIIGKA